MHYLCRINDYSMFGLRLPEIIFIALIILLLFGGKKIPEMMKGLGRGVRSFKEGMNDTTADGDYDKKQVSEKSDADEK